QQPSVTSPPHTVPLHIERPSPQKGLTRFEKSMISLFSMVVIGLSVLNISAGTKVNRLNQAQQDATREIEVAQLRNTNLEQQAQELSRYDRIYRIAEEFGLEIKEENVRNVGR